MYTCVALAQNTHFKLVMVVYCFIKRCFRIDQVACFAFLHTRQNVSTRRKYTEENVRVLKAMHHRTLKKQLHISNGSYINSYSTTYNNNNNSKRTNERTNAACLRINRNLEQYNKSIVQVTQKRYNTAHSIRLAVNTHTS